MKVAVIMGSQSDFNIAEKTIKLLNKFDIEADVRVISAHRALPTLIETVQQFDENQVDCVIALAGKAAHLPGVIAGMTIKPVIGVPILGSALTGLDSLLSIVQMPTGVPVATVAVNGAENAAILAAQILSLKYDALKEDLKAYKQELQESVLKQDQEVRR